MQGKTAPSMDQQILTLHEEVIVREKNVKIAPGRSVELLDKALAHAGGDVQVKRCALEILICLCCKQPVDKVSPSLLNKLIAYLKKNEYGPADYELRVLLMQFLFNLRKAPKIEPVIESIAMLRPLLSVRSKDFDACCAEIITHIGDIPLLPLVELKCNMKHYNAAGAGLEKIRLALNAQSISTNVQDPISGEDLLIEIMYGSVEAWHLTCEDIIANLFVIDLKLMDSTHCSLGFNDLKDLMRARDFLVSRIGKAPSKKVSAVQSCFNESQIATRSSTMSMVEPPEFDESEDESQAKEVEEEGSISKSPEIKVHNSPEVRVCLPAEIQARKSPVPVPDVRVCKITEIQVRKTSAKARKSEAKLMTPPLTVAKTVEKTQVAIAPMISIDPVSTTGHYNCPLEKLVQANLDAFAKEGEAYIKKAQKKLGKLVKAQQKHMIPKKFKAKNYGGLFRKAQHFHFNDLAKTILHTPMIKYDLEFKLDLRV